MLQPASLIGTTVAALRHPQPEAASAFRLHVRCFRAHRLGKFPGLLFKIGRRFNEPCGDLLIGSGLRHFKQCRCRLTGMVAIICHSRTTLGSICERSLGTSNTFLLLSTKMHIVGIRVQRPTRYDGDGS